MSLEEKINPEFKPFHYDYLSKSKIKTDDSENSINSSINSKIKNNILYIPKTNSPNKKNEKLSLEIHYNIPNDNSSILNLHSINLINKVEDLRNLIKEEITKIIRKKFPNYIIQNISLLGGNSFLSDGKLLIEYNLSNIINAIVVYKLNETNNNDSKIVPLELIPKLTKSNYKTNPEYYILCRMSIDELKNISNFKIYNEYGEVQFLNNVNLLGLDLDKECVIEKGCIELKERLNVKRKCILYNFKLDNGNENSMDNFKKVISKNNGVFISYEPKTGRLEWDYNEKVN